MNVSKRPRTTTPLVTLVAALLFAGSASSAYAQGPSWQDLADRGWTCFAPPSMPDRVACFNPAQGRPIIGNTDPPASYSNLQFSASGELLATGHLIRADLYRGQPCGAAGAPYTFLALIGYYECVHPRT
jgi:hypothetical protein